MRGLAVCLILELLPLCSGHAGTPGDGKDVLRPPNSVFRIEAESLIRPMTWEVARATEASGHCFWRSGKSGETGESGYGDFMVSEGGRFFVWVRSHAGPGTAAYRVQIGDANVGVFGGVTDVAESFIFQKSDVTLDLVPNRRVEVRLTAEAENAGCDLILLTKDPGYGPPDAPAAIARIEPLTSAATVSSLSGVRTDGSGPRILLLHGDRPWMAGETAAVLRRAGCSVRTLDSRLLDGLGGARIAPFVSDPHEPVASDGMTPEFSRLADYVAVLVMAIPPDEQKKLFSPERRRQMDLFVENGGALLVLENAPDTLGALSAVEAGEGNFQATTARVRRPESASFQLTPEVWPYLGSGHVVRLRPDSRAIGAVTDSDGNAIGVFAAIRPIQRGRVGYLNCEIRHGDGLLQFRDWAYFGTVLTGLLQELIGPEGITPQATLHAPFPIPPVKPIGAFRLSVEVPRMEESGETNAAVIRELGDPISVRFENGMMFTIPRKNVSAVFEISPEGRYELSGPKLLSPASPVITDGSSEQIQVGGGTAEIRVSAWDLAGWCATDRGGVALTLTNGAYAVRWTLEPKRLNLDGREYAGFMDRVDILTAPEPVESVLFETRTRMGPDLSGHRAWRFACYSSPRGFAETAFDTGIAATTRSWQFFCSGQPFTWLLSPTGVGCRFVDAPIPVYVEQRVPDAATDVIGTHRLLLGKPRVPVAVPGIWHLFSSDNRDPVNGWMAMLQFQRRRLCRVADLPPSQPLPLALYQNTCTPEQADRAALAAKSLGFEQIGLPWAVSALERMREKRSRLEMAQALAAGLRPKPWTPKYALGLDDPIAVAHPEWLVYRKDGRPLMDFGKHPVFDFNLPAYQQYYLTIVDEGIQNGLRDLYIDMGGAHSEVIQQSREFDSAQLTGMTAVFRELRKRGVNIAIEGQNPLVLDSFWYRPDLYTDFSGREHFLVGMVPGTHGVGADLALTYFRLGMMNAFPYVSVDGYANGFERTPGEMAAVTDIGRLNPMFTAALHRVGFPFVRKTEFGSSWISDQGGALFIWDPVEELHLDLPSGWRVQSVLTPDGTLDGKGNGPYRLPHRSVILLGPEENGGEPEEKK